MAVRSFIPSPLPTPHILHSHNEPLRLFERQLLFNVDEFQKKKPRHQ
jgi:hypothetical protein